MPTPIGHAMAGVAAAWAADLVPGDRAWRTASRFASWFARAGNGLTLGCACLAVAPDIDLVFLPFNAHGHRTVTHSVGAVLFVGLVAAVMAVRARRPVARVVLMCAAAYATHLLMDWMGADNFPPRGVQLLWPFSHAWYISDWDVFRQTARRQITSPTIIRVNLLAIAQEVAILLPIVVALWSVRVKALAGLATELPSRDLAAK
jgi:inner membrane protein